MGRKKNPPAGDEKTSGESEKKPKKSLASDVKRSIAAVFLFALAIIFLLGFLDWAGALGGFLNKTSGLIFGWGKWVFPLVLAIGGIILLYRKEAAFYITKLIGLGVAFFSVLGLLHIYFEPDRLLALAKVGIGGGYAGYLIALGLLKLTGLIAGTVMLGTLFFIGMIMAFNFSIVTFFEKILNKMKKEEEAQKTETEFVVDNGPAVETAAAVEENKTAEDTKVGEEKLNMEQEKIAEANIGKIEFVEGPDKYAEDKLFTGISHKNFDIQENSENKFGKAKKNISKGSLQWQLPPAELLEKSKGGAESGDTERNVEIIQKTLSHFGIEVEKGGVQTGPAVTQYSFRPAVGVKVAQIMALQNDLSLALAKHPIRIEAPIPGKSLIGIEVPNNVPAMVRLRDLIECDGFRTSGSKLTLALGEDVSGNYILEDLGKMPHLLIAGATGTGKSVSVSSVITTLLYQNSPDDLKFILIDPKMVELSLYSGIPHLLTPVITEKGKVIGALRYVVGEMGRRYRLLQDMKSQNIDSYNEKMAKGQKKKYSDPETGKTIEEPMEKMPYIVVVIDELADLMMSHGKDIETAIVSVAQMARAVGIHLVISTQRPEVKIITGLIKANINARIAFKVNTQVDSRTILDMAGAEKLLGSGDMLFLSASSPKPKRIQGIFISEKEVKDVVKFIKDQAEKIKKKHGEAIDAGNVVGISESTTNPVFGQSADIDLNAPSENYGDDFYEAAKEEVIRAGKASASLLQRRLRVGYSRAARLLDILEDNGIIGPSDGAKPREVYTLVNPREHPEKNDLKQAEKTGGAVSYESPIEDQTERDKWQI